MVKLCLGYAYSIKYNTNIFNISLSITFGKYSYELVLHIYVWFSVHTGRFSVFKKWFSVYQVVFGVAYSYYTVFKH